MQALLDKGAEPERAPDQEGVASQHDFDQSGVDEIGATRVLARAPTAPTSTR